MSKTIVLDCDGVLLDYHEAFGRVCSHYLQQPLKAVNPLAFHSEEYYGIKLSPTQKKEFFAVFNDMGWHTMQPLSGAIKATHLLKSAGYKIIVVTSIPHSAKECRYNNLLNLGFSIDDIFTTGQKLTNDNPKREYIHNLKPDYFVDDMIENFHTVEGATQFVLINNKKEGNPNDAFPHPIDLYSEHETLLEFVTQHIAS